MSTRRGQRAASSRVHSPALPPSFLYLKRHTSLSLRTGGRSHASCEPAQPSARVCSCTTRAASFPSYCPRCMVLLLHATDCPSHPIPFRSCFTPWHCVAPRCAAAQRRGRRDRSITRAVKQAAVIHDMSYLTAVQLDGAPVSERGRGEILREKKRGGGEMENRRWSWTMPMAVAGWCCCVLSRSFPDMAATLHCSCDSAVHEDFLTPSHSAVLISSSI